MHIYVHKQYVKTYKVNNKYKSNACIDNALSQNMLRTYILDLAQCRHLLECADTCNYQLTTRGIKTKHEFMHSLHMHSLRECNENDYVAARFD